VATVTGVTLQKMLQIKNDTIISARVENGVLYFKKGDNQTEFDVGRIILPAIDAWPVGSIFMNVTSTNPKTLLGVPSNSPVTWVRWGLGKMPISLDPNNARFDTSEETGGLERVQLTQTEMPSHDHGGSTGWQSHDHGHTGYAHAAGSHTHGQAIPNHRSGISGGGGLSVADNSNYVMQTDAAGYHDHAVTTNGVSQNHYHSITSNGGNAPHENMPPFITVYMWKRTV
jgi:microcystin-dependent protein